MRAGYATEIPFGDKALAAWGALPALIARVLGWAAFCACTAKIVGGIGGGLTTRS